MARPFPSERLGLRRSIVANQLLLSGAALLGVAMTIVSGQVVNPPMHVVGAALVFGITIVAVLTPWDRLALWVAGLVFIIDVVAVAFLRESAPNAGLGLLWTFPALWIGAAFGVRGIVLFAVVICVVMAHQLMIDVSQKFGAVSIVLPFMLTALASLAHVTARRSNAQRALLEKQSAELRRAVDRARAQEDLVTEVLDAVDFGVSRVTPEGELVVTNTAHGRLLDTTDGLGREIAVYAADGVTPLRPSVTPLTRARAGEVFEGELVWYGEPGQGRRALSITARRLPPRLGGDPGGLLVSRDVTAEEQARRAQEDLVSSVSHELRTPLTSILGYLELALADSTLSAPARARLEIAERNATRLTELVADILALSAAPGQGFGGVLVRELTDVSALVRCAIESVAPVANERGLHLDVDGIDEVSAVVDAHRVRQVVDNLLSNAVKYNSRGGTVTVTVDGDEHAVRIIVADDGPGISPGEQSQLFDRFFRGDAVRKSSIHGSGLGLTISRDFARAHGGDITVRTAPGEGSAFTVRLPREGSPS